MRWASLYSGTAHSGKRRVGYHSPKVENIEHAVRGIHAGLSEFESLPENYEGVAIYCGWQMTEQKWEAFRIEFEKD